MNCLSYKVKEKLMRTVEVSGKDLSTLDANGTLKNIQQYAALVFTGGINRELAFINIISVFFNKLYEKVLQNGVSKKKNYNDQFKIYFSYPVALIELDNHDDFSIGKDILPSLHNFNNDDNAGKNISMASLNLPTNTMVQIKYIASSTDDVPI